MVRQGAVTMFDGIGVMSQSWTLSIPLFGFLAAAVVWDLYRRRIPNAIPLALAVLGLAANFVLRPVGPALLVSMGGLLVGFAFWLIPYLLRVAGAADLKLAAAVGVWLGPLGALRASFWAALAGGILAILWLLRYHGMLGGWVYLTATRRTRRRDERRGELKREISVPYALAIAAGVACELLGFDLPGGWL